MYIWTWTCYVAFPGTSVVTHTKKLNLLVYFTGPTNTLERVSPRVIVLNPPEKLVIETKSSGGYQHYDWTINGVSAADTGATVQEFPNFFEIFVREPTTMDDLGVYAADLSIAPGQTQIPDLEFVVTRYGKNRNTSNYHMTLIFTSELLFQLKIDQDSVCYWQNIISEWLWTSAPPPTFCMLPSHCKLSHDCASMQAWQMYGASEIHGHYISNWHSLV